MPGFRHQDDSMKDRLYYDREREFYDRSYSLHEAGIRTCRTSLFDLDKANRRVAGVFSIFRIDPRRPARGLDVGSGLGCYTEALSRTGMRMTGIDISPVAVKLARRRFPDPDFVVGLYPETVTAAYDLIWAVDVSSLNTLNPVEIDGFVSASLKCLNPGGALVIGWHTDFSGRIIRLWANWSGQTMDRMRRRWGFEGPAILEARAVPFRSLLPAACKMIRKTVPVFLVLKTDAAGSDRAPRNGRRRSH